MGVLAIGPGSTKRQTVEKGSPLSPHRDFARSLSNAPRGLRTKGLGCRANERQSVERTQPRQKTSATRAVCPIGRARRPPATPRCPLKAKGCGAEIQPWSVPRRRGGPTFAWRVPIREAPWLRPSSPPPKRPECLASLPGFLPPSSGCQGVLGNGPRANCPKVLRVPVPLRPPNWWFRTRGET